MVSATRVILHVDMDAFFASVEQLDNPSLAGKPVVVGAAADRRGVVAAASYEARKFGVHSAMPSRTAAKICPHAIFIRPRFYRYEEMSKKVFSILAGFTPFVEQVSIDEAFLDVTSALRLFGDPVEIGKKIKKEIYERTRLPSSVGIAPNKFLAKLASEMGKPDGLFVVPFDKESIRKFLAPLDLEKLYGVGKATLSLFHKHKLFKIKDLQNISPSYLSSIIGKSYAAELIKLSVGDDDRPVEIRNEVKSISREITFDEDNSSRDEVKKSLLMLVLDVGRQLRKNGKYAGSVQIKVRWSDFTTITRQKTLAWPVCDDFSLREAAMSVWQNITEKRPIRLIGFGVNRLTASNYLQLEFTNKGVSPNASKLEDLSKTVDKLKEKFGDNVIKSASLIDKCQ